MKLKTQPEPLSIERQTAPAALPSSDFVKNRSNPKHSPRAGVVEYFTEVVCNARLLTLHSSFGKMPTKKKNMHMKPVFSGAVLTYSQCRTAVCVGHSLCCLFPNKWVSAKLIAKTDPTLTFACGSECIHLSLLVVRDSGTGCSPAQCRQIQ